MEIREGTNMVIGGDKVEGYTYKASSTTVLRNKRLRGERKHNANANRRGALVQRSVMPCFAECVPPGL
jgi:hypothetical protein